MAEPDSMQPEDAAAQRAAEQARLRKERREAKIKAGGAARLNKITGLNGGLQRDVTSTPPLPPSDSQAAGPFPAPARPAAGHGDPDEVDISQHFYAPDRRPGAPARDQPMPAMGSDAVAEARLRQLMLGGGAPPPPQQPQGPGAEQMADDPMVKLLSQLMGQEPGAEGAADDPMMKMFSQLMGQGAGAGAGAAGSPFGAMPPAQAQAQAGRTDAKGFVWSLAHVLLSLGLGLYIALWTTFSGSKLERDSAELAAGFEGGEQPWGYKLFWVFATAEAMLLTTRLLADGGKPALGGGMLDMALGFVPPAVRDGVGIVVRYAKFFGQVRRDLMLLTFVLGICSWLRR